MTRPRILIVEDQPQVLFTLRPALQNLRFTVEHVATIQSAVQKLHASPYKVVVLDRNLPDGDGLELLPLIDDISLDTKTLVLSERGETPSRIEGLQKGADDYLPKPFALDEFTARVQALMRRSKHIRDTSFLFQGIKIVPDQRRLQYKGQRIQCTDREFDLLLLFLHQPRQVLPRTILATKFWPTDFFPTKTMIDVSITRLRKRLEKTPLRVETRYRVGYALVTKKP